MFSRLRGIIRNQKGYTLFETLVALAILGFIAPALSMSIYQVLNINELAGNHMTVIKQAESAMHWLSGDALMAQTVQTGGRRSSPCSRRPTPIPRSSNPGHCTPWS